MPKPEAEQFKLLGSTPTLMKPIFKRWRWDINNNVMNVHITHHEKRKDETGKGFLGDPGGVKQFVALNLQKGNTRINTVLESAWWDSGRGSPPVP